MNSYLICTDSACDLPSVLLDELGIKSCPLTFRFDGDDKEYENGEMDTKTFYNRMRGGECAKTSAVNSEVFKNFFDKLLSEGNDIYYLGFSSGLSTTYNSARIAADELRSVYPDRKIIVCDSLAASAGFGLLLYYAFEKKKSGATIEELSDYIESIKMNVCLWFTVDDLVYLKRGGRISPTVAFVGNALGLKPVLHMDNEGHLVSVSKVRGRKNAISALVAKYTELAKDPGNSIVYISHSDCYDDAKLLSDMINEKHGVSASLITDVGPVIGAHSGPGTLALFFIGKEK